ncbi:MAG: hypothetical protein H0T50_16405 [Gemmatimonadales bacterium]|nr:hypothetical protein [Gemmatimonadales bacterium]
MVYLAPPLLTPEGRALLLQRTIHWLPATLSIAGAGLPRLGPGGPPQTADELARRLGSVRTAEEWTPRRAKEWWEESRPASPASAAEPVPA